MAKTLKRVYNKSKENNKADDNNRRETLTQFLKAVFGRERQMTLYSGEIYNQSVGGDNDTKQICSVENLSG